MLREQGGSRSNLTFSILRNISKKKIKIGNFSNNYAQREILTLSLEIMQWTTGVCHSRTFSCSSYQLLPLAGSRRPNTLRCEDSTETGLAEKRPWHPSLRKEVKARLPLQLFFFLQSIYTKYYKGFALQFQGLSSLGLFCPPLLYSTPFPPPLWFWVKGKQFLFFLFSCPAFP